MEINYKKRLAMDPSGFVLLSDYVPGILQEIRYHSTYNFVGDRIDGYEEPCALLTREAARALKTVSNEMNAQGYRLKIFDAYRPACAVRHFVLWGIEDLDLRMKPYFYPDLEKQSLFAQGYIASQSSHSRGSTVDLTLLDMTTGREVDMGSPLAPSTCSARFPTRTTGGSPRSSTPTGCSSSGPWSAAALPPSTASGGTSPWRMSPTRIPISSSRSPRRI